MVKSGAGTIILSAANTYTGVTTVTGGTLQIGSAATGSIADASNIINNGTVSFGRTNAYTYAGAISGTGGVTNSGAGSTIVLSGANTYSGITTVNAGALTLAGSGVSAGGLVMNAGGTLNLDFTQAAANPAGIVAASAPVTFAGGTLNVIGNTGSTQTLGAVTATTGSSTLSASGNVTLTLGQLSHTGAGVLNFVLPGGPTVVKTTGTSVGGIVGGWAVTSVGGTPTWVAVDGAGNLSALTNFSTDTWNGGNVTVTTTSSQANNASANSLYFNTSGSNTVNLNGVSQITSGGILVTTNVGSNASTITGGTITAGTPGNGGELFIQQNNVGASSALIINSAIADNGAGATALTKVGAGSLVLGGANTYTGRTLVAGGNVTITNPLTTMGTAIVNAGTTLQFGDGSGNNGGLASSIVNNGTVIIANPSDQTFSGAFNSSPNFAFTNNALNSPTSNQNATFIKTGNGALTITSTVVTNQFHQQQGNTILDNGANVLVNGFNSVGLAGGDNATLTLRGSSRMTESGDFNVGDRTGANGTVKLQDVAQLNLGNFFVGKTGNAAGTVTQTGGAVTNGAGNTTDWRIGGSVPATYTGGVVTTPNDINATGTYNLMAGTFQTGRNFQIGAGGTGTFTQTGGAVSVTGGFNVVGRYFGSNGLLDISNGTYTVSSGSRMIIGESGMGTLNVSGAGQLNFTATAAGAGLGLGGDTAGLGVGAGVGTINLNGGLIQTPQIIDQNTNAADGTSTFNFNGGVLRVTSGSASAATFMQGLTSAVVKSSGAIIDTNGVATTIAQPLLQDGGDTSGSLTKVNTGNLTLTGTNGVTLGTSIGTPNTYKGSTNVNGGGLILDVGGFTSTTPANLIDSQSALQLNGGTLTLLGHRNGAATTGLTATTALNSNILTAISSTATLAVGQAISGANIPAGSIITSIPSTTSVTISAPATAAGTAQALTLTAATFTSSQTFSSTIINGGANGIVASVNGGGGTTINLGSLSRNSGSAVDFSLPATGAITTTSQNTATTILGGWATVNNGAGWAVSAGDGSNPGNITPLGTYTSQTWAAANNTDVTGAVTQTSATTNSVRFNAASAFTLTLANTNTINSGGLLVTPTVAGNNLTITGGTLTTPGDLNINQFNTGTLTLTSVLNQPGNLVKAGGGVTILNAADTYGGDTIIGAGTLRIAAANRIPDNSNVVINAGASFDLANFAETINGLSGYGQVINSVAGTPTLTVGAGNNSSTFSGILVNGTGNLNLTKIGGGTLTLNNVAAGSYTGSTNINAGSIDIATPNALSNNTTINVNTFAGLLFDTTVPLISGLGGNASGNIPLQTQGGLPVQLTVGNNSPNANFAGGLSGPGTLIKIGTGVQILSGSNNNDGGVVVNAGFLALSGFNGGSSGTSYANSGGTLVIANPDGFYGSGRSVVVANGGAVAIGTMTADPASRAFPSFGSALSRINPASTGVFALTSDGSVQTPINEDLDFSAAGPGGALNVSLGAVLTATPGLGNAPVRYTGVITPNAGTFRLGGGNGRLILPNAATLAGANSLVIGGGGNLGGQLYLLADFGFTGSTSIQSGNTIVTSLSNGGVASPLGASSAAAGNLILNGGTLQYVGNGSSTDRLFTVSTSPTAIDSSGTAPLNFTNPGAIGFLNAGARTLTLQGNNTALNTLAAAIGDSVNIAGANGTVASATTALVKNGNGTWVLSGANTFSGGVTVNNGVLVFANAGAIGGNTVTGPASVTVNAGGAAALGSALTGSLQSSLSRISPFSTGTVALTANTSENLNFDGGANGAALPLAFLGAYGNVTYTGTLNPFGNAYRLGGGGGVLTLPNGGLTGPRNVQIGGGGPGNSLLSSPNLNGAVVLGGTNDYSGGTQILSGGILSATNLGALGSGPLKFQGGVYRVLPDATDITLAADGVSTREIRLGADASSSSVTAGLEVVSGVNATFSKTFGTQPAFGANQGAEVFTKYGGGSLTLANGLYVNGVTQSGVVAGTNTGTVIIERGTLSIQNNPNFFSGLIQIGSNNGGVGTLKLGGNNVFANGGPAYGAGSIIEIYNGSKIDLNGFSDTLRLVRGGGGIVNTGAPATLTVGTANDQQVVAGNLSGNFNVVIAGQQTNPFGTGANTSSLELWNNSNPNFTGKFVANGAGLRIRADGTLGSSSEPFAADKVTLNNNSVLYTSGGAAVVIGANHGITLGAGGGTLWSFSSGPLVVNSPITGPGQLTVANDTGIVFLNNDNNNYAGGTQINSDTANRGILVIGTGGATGSLPAGDVFFNSGAGLARLAFLKSTDMTVANNIYGPGTIMQLGGGTTTLSGNNVVNQTTVVAGGRLKAIYTDPTKSPIGTGTNLQLSAGAFEYVGPAGDNVFRLGALTGTSFSSTNGLLTTAMVGGGIGDATVQSTYGGSGVQQLIFGGNTRTANSAITTNFITSGGVNGVTNRIEFAAGPAVNNVIGGAYFFNGADFAAYDVGNFVRAANYGADANTANLNAMTGSRYTKLTNTINNQAAVTMFGINLSGATAGLNMTGVLTMSSNVSGTPSSLLKSGGGTSVIGGSGSITNNTTNSGELIVRTDTAADILKIDIPINGTGILAKSGLGQLTLTAQNGYTGNTLLTQGTILVTDSGSLGSSTSGEIRIATVPGMTGTLNIDSPSATVTAGNPANAFRVGEAGIGFVNQTAGTVNVANYLTIGESIGSTGTYNISSGTLNVKTNTGTPPAGAAGQNNLVVGRVGTGTMNISGDSTVNVMLGAQMLLGMGTNNSGQFQAMVPNVALSTGVGTVNQTGGTVNVANTNGNFAGNVMGAVIVGVDGTGAYNLTGGTLNAPILGRGNGTASFTLGSATLRATANTLNVDLPMSLTSSAANKSILDTNGNDITFSNRMTGAGGVAKVGDGTLTMIGSSTYTGGTDVTSGNLVASGNALGTGAVNVASGSTLTVRGIQQGLLAKFYLAAHTDINPNQTLPNPSNNVAPEFASLDNFNNFLAGKDAIAVETTTARGKISVDYLDLGGANQNSALPPAIMALSNGSNPFVAQLTGKFNATTTGDYNFQTRSDDGSVVWIDGAPVLDNNRSQGQTTRSGSVNLTAGLHDIVVGYYQGGGGAGFSVGVTTPDQGQSFTIGNELNLPNSLLSNGTDALTIGSLVGSGNVDLGNGTLSTGNDNSSTTFTGIIAGAGNLSKDGTGTMTIPNTTAYTGTTTVNNGTLSVTGSVASSSNVIANGPGIFQAVGAQTLQGLTVNTGGTAKVLDGVTTGFIAGNGGTVQIGSSNITTGGGNVTTSYAGNITGTGGLIKIGTGVQGLTGANSYTGPTSINAGTLSVSGSILSSSAVTATTGGTFEASGSTRVRNLTLNGGLGKVTSMAAAVRTVLTVGDGSAPNNQLNLTGGGKMDLTTNAMVIDYAPGNDALVSGSVRAQIIAGYHPSSPNAGDGDWKGTTGITSSSIGSLNAIGYAVASDVLPFANGATTDTFLGTTVDKSTILARFVLTGDINLDGSVDFQDLAKLAQSYNVTDGSRVWATGDINYDGNTDFLDLAKLAQNYNTALPSAPIPGASASFEADLARAFATVPEPGTISILGIGALALLARRRNRRAA